MQKKYLFFLLPLLLFVLAASSPSPVRVGIYHNPPLSFMENNQPNGFFVDVLDRIAEEEGWQLEYYPCEWEACLQALENGEIDLLGPIAYSEERSKRFDFSQETMLTNWGQVYVQSGETNISILDLENKSVALLKGDTHADAFLTLAQKFAIQIKPTYFDNYSDILAALAEKQVYAGVLNHIFAMQHAHGYAIEETGIIFNPIEVRFATTKGQNLSLLNDLDARIAALKADKGSLYYRGMNSWLHAEYTQPQEVSRWVFFVVAGVLLLLAGLLGINRFLRAEVRKRTGETQHSREELALILDRIPEMISFLDKDLRYIYADEGYAAWYGFKKEELVGKYVKDILPPENYAKVRPRLLEVVATGKEIYYRHEVVRIDGTKADVSISYVPKKDQDGNVEAFFATVRDITHERLAERALVESEAKYRLLVDNALVGIIIVQGGKVVFANQGVEKLFGYESVGEMLGLDFENLVAPQDFGHVFVEGRDKETDIKQKSQYVFKALRKNGTVFDAEIVSQVIAYGGKKAIQGMVIDISERVKAEERFRHLSEASYEALFISEKGICLEQNATAQRIFGYTDEEAVGRMGTDWIAHEDREIVIHHMLAGYEEPYRVTALRKDGTTFPCEIVARMMDYEGRRVRLTALRDITVQVEAEENLRESEERYRSIIQKNQAIMLLIDPLTGDIVEANAAASQFYGWTQQELQEKRISDINILDDDEVYDRTQKAKTDQRNPFFFRHRLANGDIRDVEVYSTPLNIYGRELLHSIIYDISERTRAEKELVETKERFERVVAEMPVPVLLTDENNDVVFYNDQFIETFGYTLEDIRSADEWWQRVYPDEEYRAWVQASWENAIENALAAGQRIATQVWDVVRKDGAVRTVELDMMPMGDLSVIAMNDVTDRIRASIELKESEAKLREAQKIGKMGHWELDVRSNQLSWSEQLYRIFQIEPETFEGSYDFFLNTIHPEDRERVNNAYLNSLETKEPYEITHRLLLKNGEVRYVRELCKTYYDDEGDPLRSIGTVQDVTDVVRAEQVMNLRAELAEYSLTHSLSELLRKTLDEAEALTNSKIGFYHFVNNDQKSISLQQWSTDTVEHYCDIPDLGRHDPVEKAGIWVECIKMQAPTIHNDYASMKNTKGLPKGHAALERELVVPVIRGGKVRAILGMGNKPTEYTEQDVEIVSQIADLCWEIAENKLTEEALSESESLLNETQKLARLGSYRFYIHSAHWTSNSVLDEIFGIDDNYDRSTEGWLGLIHPGDRPMMEKYLLEDVLGDKKPFDKRCRIVNQKSKETRWVHGLGKLEYDGEDHLVSMVGTIQDITARALIELELALSEHRLRTLINATPDIICFKDGEGHWLTANQADIELFELTGVDYVGKTDRELAEYSDFYHDAFLACEETDEISWQMGGLSRGVEVISIPAGDDKVYDVIKVPLFKDDGSREGLVVLGRDITQQTEFQNELQRHARQLEIVNAISTALSTSLELGNLLETILRQVVQVINCDSTAIFLVDDDQNLRVVNAVGSAEQFIGRTFTLEETLMNKIAKDEKVLMMDDASTDPEHKVWGDFIVRSWMGLPLYAHELLVGYLTFDSLRPGVFTDSDASLAVAFATQVAQALYNAQLHERIIADANDLEKYVQKRTEELQRFVDLTAGREIRMIELKEMIRELRRQLVRAGQVPVVGEELGSQ